MRKTFLNLFIILFTCSVCTYGQAGSLDSTFGMNGIVSHYRPDVSMDRFGLQQDGKIISGGDIEESGTNYTHDFCVGRYNTDGSIDSTFGTNGIASFPMPGTHEEGFAVFVQPDDKILMAGYSESNYTNFAVCRFNADGSIDTSFADNGIKVMPYLGLNARISCIGIQGDSSKIILAGRNYELGTYLPIVVRLNENGSIDSTFATNGVFTSATQLNWFRYPNDLKIQPDNKIVLSVSAGSSVKFGVVRLTSDGNLDNSFGTGGYNMTNINGLSTAIELQPDGKIIQLGLSAGSTKLIRLNTAGDFDNAFGNNGVKVISVNGYGVSPANLKFQQSDNKIIVAGQIEPTSSQHSKFFITRLNPDGSTDTDFGTEPGYTAIRIDSNDISEGPRDILFQDDDKIIVGGWTIQPVIPRESATSMARYISCGISVTNQPADETAHLGASADFTVGSTSASANYQWQTLNNNNWEDLSNGGQYSGTQTATLHIANITMANNLQKFRSIALSGVCSDTSSAATLTVDSTTGINDVAVIAGIKIYPNPIKSRMNIRIGNPIYRQGSIKVINSLGINTHTIILKGKQEIEIDTKSWPSGVYSLEIIPEKGLPATLRAVKI